MYTEYNSQNVEKNNNEINYDNYNSNSNSNNKNNNFEKDPNIYVTEQKQTNGNKILSMVWKILLVIIVLIVLFIALIQFGVISFGSDVAPEVVLLNQNEVGLKRYESYQLVHSVLPDNSTNKQVVFESSDPSVVEVNEATGYITAKKNGTATITVKTLINERISECVVTVGNKVTSATGIALNEKNINLAVKNNSYLTYRMIPSNSTAGSLVFSSSDPSVATVNSKGRVTAVKPGNAVITVSSVDGTIKDTSYVTVYEKGKTTVVSGSVVNTSTYPTSVKLNNTSMNLTIGSTSQLIGTVSPAQASQTLNWSSNNTNVVTVNQSGLVKAVGAGNATVVAKTINGITATCNITVGNYSNKLKKIEITVKESAIPVNREKQLIVAFTPSTATNKTITWTSDNTAVATVDSSGLVKTIAPGTATITARAADGGLTSTAKINVYKDTYEVLPTSVWFAQSNYKIGIGTTLPLTPGITPSKVTETGFTFKSSDVSIATIDSSGTVYGKKAGTVTITATSKASNHLQAKTTVVVSKIEAKSIKLNSTDITFYSGSVCDTFQLVPELQPSNATKETMTFTSSDTKVATVDKNGKIKAINTGTTTIRVVHGNVSATAIVRVPSSHKC